MSSKVRDIIDFVVASVNEFSETHRMNCIAGFDYLRECEGLSFLERNYDVEHAYSIEDVVSDLAQVCRKHGGSL